MDSVMMGLMAAMLEPPLLDREVNYDDKRD